MVTESKIPDGYKMTEMGVIPEDWEVAILSDVCNSINDGTHATPQYVGHGIPFYSVENIAFNDFFNTKFISEAEHSRLIKRCKPEKGDILMTRITSGSLGDTKLLDWDVNASIYVSLALIKPSSRIKSEYLYSYSKSSVFVSDVEKRSLMNATPKKINLGEIGEIPIPIPPLPEQAAIANVLSDVDSLITSLDKVITKKKDIKQGAMQELLTGKRRLPGFSGEWVLKRVSELGEIITGGTPSTQIGDYWNGSIPWVTPTDICDEKDIWCTGRSITELGLSKVRQIPRDSVLVTCIASIGKNAILRKDGACNQQINAIVTNPQHCEEFLYYLMELNKQYLIANAGTTATSIISKKDFSLFLFHVPLLPEQQAIAQILSDMDTEITQLEQKKLKYIALKQAMMQELLTGRIRLV